MTKRKYYDLQDAPDEDEEGFPADLAFEHGEELAEWLDQYGSDAAGWANDIISDADSVADELEQLANHLYATSQSIRDTWRNTPQQRGVR